MHIKHNSAFLYVFYITCTEMCTQNWFVHKSVLRCIAKKHNMCFHLSILKECSSWKFFRNTLILHDQYSGYWWAGNARNQDISRNDIDELHRKGNNLKVLTSNSYAGAFYVQLTMLWATLYKYYNNISKDLCVLCGLHLHFTHEVPFSPLQ